MIVEFSDAALADGQSWSALSQIFALFVHGRHTWLVRDWDAIVASAWYRDLGRSLSIQVNTLGRKALSSDRGARHLVVVMGSEDPPLMEDREIRLPAREARPYLAQPLHLVVEDGPTDGSFIRSILLIFGEKRLPKLLGRDEFEGIKSRWTAQAFGDGTFFRVVHGGGSRIGHAMKGHFQPSPSSMLAIVDSDHPVPQPEFNPLPRTTWDEAQQVAVELAQAGASVPLPTIRALRRREMENYLPPGALKERYPAKSRWVDAYAGLDEAHRAHFDVKEGLSSSLQGGVAWQWKSQPEKAFWEGPATQGERRQLLRGLGPKVSECWKCPGVQRQAMTDWAGQELDEIVNVVLSLL